MGEPLAVVLGCSGVTLSSEEKALFREYQPFGFILFGRNCESPDQVKGLVRSLKETCGEDTAILIDQEGGRVSRLKSPYWPMYPSARAIGHKAQRDRTEGLRIARVYGLLLAAMLYPLSINVNCAPVCDLEFVGAHGVIGDRAFCRDPWLVSELAEEFCRGMMSAGVLPVIKHIPGHGRAKSDSHKELPVIEAARTVLQRTDFVPFSQLADMPLGMVAHILYKAYDPKYPASVSKRIIHKVIRQQIGFKGLLFSDDIAMEALEGTLSERTLAVLNAGCDIVLYGGGILKEMRKIVNVVPKLTHHAQKRWKYAQNFLHEVQKVDVQTLQNDLFSSLHED